jgi:hypothetical protein
VALDALAEARLLGVRVGRIRAPLGGIVQGHRFEGTPRTRRTTFGFAR